MNKAELTDKVREATGLSRTQAESVVDETLGAVVATIKAGERVSLFGFGTFTPSARAARIGRNPRTGEAVKIPATRGVRFAPASAFKAALNPPKPAAKKAGKAAAPAKKAGKTAAAKKAAPAKAAPAKKAAKKAAKSTKR